MNGDDRERQGPTGPDPRPAVSGPAKGSAAAGTGGSIGMYAGVGLQFAVTIVAFLLGGQWLDRRLGTAPWLMIAGVFLGAAGAFYSMYRRLMAALKREEEDRRRIKADRETRS